MIIVFFESEQDFSKREFKDLYISKTMLSIYLRYSASSYIPYVVVVVRWKKFLGVQPKAFYCYKLCYQKYIAGIFIWELKTFNKNGPLEKRCSPIKMFFLLALNQWKLRVIVTDFFPTTFEKVLLVVVVVPGSTFFCSNLANTMLHSYASHIFLPAMNTCVDENWSVHI